MNRLRSLLHRLDGRGYGGYKELLHQEFHFPGFHLRFLRVQPDPFAPPSVVQLRMDQQVAKYPPALMELPVQRTALRDFLQRRFWQALRPYPELSIDPPGNEILDRTGCLINSDEVVVRLTVQLPASGRRIRGYQAATLLCEQLPAVVMEVLPYDRQPLDRLQKHLEVAIDAETIRSRLAEMGLVAFIANGSILPRESGISENPMPSPPAVPFQSPPELECEFEVPHHGRIRGMGIPEGVTLIVGGGFHGKSTLLRALERGVYLHIPGDGREFVVTNPTAVKIRAEDGRCVHNVNISPFIAHLPMKIDTAHFSTENASGSTSQAANIIEALEAGAEVLLIDEDTSATNFMIRDARMQALIAKDREPITPFIDRVRQLYEEHGVSTILVMGGSGDYFDVADTVIAMVEYRPLNVTEQAKTVAQQYPTHRKVEAETPFPFPQPRVPDPSRLQLRRGKREIAIKAKGMETIVAGKAAIDLRFVEQLVEDGQLNALAAALELALRKQWIDGRHTVDEILHLLHDFLEHRGVEGLATAPHNFAAFRMQEFAAVLNRWRALQMRSS